LEIDPDTGQVTVFDSPVDGEIAAWGMAVDVDGKSTSAQLRLLIL